LGAYLFGSYIDIGVMFMWALIAAFFTDMIVNLVSG